MKRNLPALEQESGVSAKRDLFWKRPLLPLLFSFILGIFLSSFNLFNFYLSLSLSFISLSLLSFVFFSPLFKKAGEGLNLKEHPLYFFFFFSFLPLLVFFLLAYSSGLDFFLKNKTLDKLLAFTADEVLRIEGFVKGLPHISDKRVKLYLSSPELIKKSGESFKLKGSLSLSIFGEIEPTLPGTFLSFEARLRPFTNFNNPGAFDYKKFQLKKSVYGRVWCKAENLKLIDDKPPAFSARIDRFRLRLSSYISENVKDRDSAAILKAMLIGDKRELDFDLRRKYGRTGLAHLLAISGLHMGLITGLVFFLSKRFFSFFDFFLLSAWPSRAAVFPAFIAAIAYALISGGAPSALRALIMSLALFFLLLLHRKTDAWSILFAAVALLLFENPERTRDIGFLLSVSAVAGLFVGFGSYPVRVKNRFLAFLSGILKSSFFASLFTAPICLFFFRELSLISPLANLFILPLLAMLALPLAVFGLVFPFFNAFFLKFAGSLVGFANIFIDWLSAFSWISLSHTGISLLEVFIFYGFLLFFFKCREKKNSYIKIFFFLFLSLLLIPSFILRYKAGPGFKDTHISVLDVGQGSSSAIRLKGGRLFLVDGGGLAQAPSFDMGRLVLSSWLDFKKISQIEALILSHPHFDHIQGFFYLAENYRVKELWISEHAVKHPLSEDLIKLLKKQGSFIRVISSEGERIDLGDVSFHFFGIDKRHITNLNNSSLVFKLETGSFSMLFTGDAEREAEAFYALEYGDKLKSDILLAGHHGSRTSSTMAFLKAVKPSFALISCAKNNFYRYPAKEVLKNLEREKVEVFRTDLGGAVCISFDKKSEDKLKLSYCPLSRWDWWW